MRCEIVRQAEALAGLHGAWGALWKVSGRRPVTLHPSWVDGWWRSFAASAGGGVEGELVVVVVREGKDVAGVAPLYLSPPRGGALRARELRLLGDGLLGVSQAVLAAPGMESRVRDEVVQALAAEPGWDLLDVTFAAGPGSDAEPLGRRFEEMGRLVERDEARGRPVAELVSPWERFVETRRPPPWMLSGLPGATLVDASLEALPDALADLESMLRLCPSPAPSPEQDTGVFRFLERVLPPLVEAGAAALRLLDVPGRRPIGGAVVLLDGERQVELLRGGDPEARATDHLSLWELRRAVEEGARRFEFAEASVLASGRAQGQRLRVFRRSAAGVLQRGYATLVRHATTVADAARAPIETIASLRDAGSRLRDAAPDAVTRAVARVATFAQLHLYRGELFVRNGTPSPGLDIRLFGYEQFRALDAGARERFLSRLDLAEPYCRQKWERGDLVVLALLDGQPAGILWCARGAVYVPDIGREVRPLAGECYIHDVYVAPDARGRAVAPAMLEFLARDLRARDVYRAWALIQRANTPSTRAFEKAAYASVADVIYARMGGASKLLVRPPDPEARAFLGVEAR